MKYKIKNIYIVTAVFSMFVSNYIVASEVYTLGVVPQFDSRAIAKIWNPIIAEIEKESSIKLKLVGAPNIPAFEKEFIQGSYDFAYMNPYHAIVANRTQKYQPIIRDVKRKLYGIIVVKKDSAIKNVKSLNGKTIAFPAPNALGATLLPQAEFETKYKIKINPKYVQSHDSVYLNVLLGQAEAGGGVKRTFDKQSEQVRSQLRILHKTEKVSPHPLVVHPRIPEEVVNKIVNAILKISGTKNGGALFNKIPMNKAGKANIDDYKELKLLGIGSINGYE